MKAAKRKELVNELRSAHFSMGFERFIFLFKDVISKNRTKI